MRIITSAKVSTSLLVALSGLACSGGPTPETPAPAEVTANTSGFFSSAQAARGREAFRAVCSECHVAGDFRGPDFEWNWRRQTAWDLYETMVETMPEDAPGSLSPATYAAVIAYILEINEYAVGSADLQPEQAAMDTVPLGPNVDKSGRSSTTGT